MTRASSCSCKSSHHTASCRCTSRNGLWACAYIVKGMLQLGHAAGAVLDKAAAATSEMPCTYVQVWATPRLPHPSISLGPHAVIAPPHLPCIENSAVTLQYIESEMCLRHASARRRSRAGCCSRPCYITLVSAISHLGTKRQCAPCCAASIHAGLAYAAATLTCAICRVPSGSVRCGDGESWWGRRRGGGGRRRSVVFLSALTPVQNRLHMHMSQFGISAPNWEEELIHTERIHTR